MANTVLTATALAKNTMSADLPVTSFTAIDAAKTMEVAFPREGKLVLILNNTTAAEKDFTVESGDYHAAGQGDLVMALAQDDVRFLVVDSDRFKQNDGKLNLTFEANTTGFVGALSLPY
jgi:hypothetical protein